MIEVTGVNKRFGEIKALDNIVATIQEGSIFGLVGTNGAGKSTTISIMCGELPSDSGSVIVDGISIDNHKEHISRSVGVVFQNSLLDKDLTVYENLKYRAGLYGIFGSSFERRLKELSDIFMLDSYLNRQIKKLSGGQKRRVDIVRALLHNPKILILDEPTTGLDPQTRSVVWQNINDLRTKQGLTVFLTTHYMEEASDADYVVILDSGLIVGEGTPHELKSKYARDYIIIYNAKEENVALLGLPYEAVNDGFKITLNNTNEAKELILKYPQIFNDFEIVKGKMDDVFLNITGKKLGGGSL